MWELTRRIRNARQKQDGFSPVALLVDDLKQNPAVDKFNFPGRARGHPAARVTTTRIAHFSVRRICRAGVGANAAHSERAA